MRGGDGEEEAGRGDEEGEGKEEEAVELEDGSRHGSRIRSDPGHRGDGALNGLTGFWAVGSKARSAAEEEREGGQGGEE